MLHEHAIIDSDVRFHIDSYTRNIKDTTPAKKTIVQYDHNSERYTFDLPRYIEGHDMTLCNVVEVHFTNTEKSTKLYFDGKCPITDLQVSPDDENTVLFSWLVSRVSTQYIGPLKFSIHFECREDDGTVTYEWNTLAFSKISVKPGMNNREAINLIDAQLEDLVDRLGLEVPPSTYILVGEDGTEYPAALVEEEVELTATSNDIRIGTTAITDTGVTYGEKVIPAYHTNEGIQIIPAGSRFVITSLKDLNLYDFTKLQAIICDYNTSLSDSVAALKVSINEKVYEVLDTVSIADVTRNDDEQIIDLGITNDSDTLKILRFITYKEIE